MAIFSKWPKHLYFSAKKSFVKAKNAINAKLLIFFCQIWMFLCLKFLSAKGCCWKLFCLKPLQKDTNRNEGDSFNLNMSWAPNWAILQKGWALCLVENLFTVNVIAQLRRSHFVEEFCFIFILWFLDLIVISWLKFRTNF